MRIDVNGVRIFFDVEGAKLVPEGPVMRERPTLIVLHGGPGQDHSFYKPRFSQFADITQVIYIDHRGNGRSDWADASTWNLAQWGDDLYQFCRALEIEHPIVLGTSFGGFVAMSYATRYPTHPGKLILASTQARFNKQGTLDQFERLGGKEARDIAERFLGGADEATLRDYVRVCYPLYLRRAARDPDVLRRMVMNPAVLLHFESTAGESTSFDLRSDLAAIRCPTLVVTGADDAVTPTQDSDEIAAAIPPGLARVARFANAGHPVFSDEPTALDAIRDFILE